LYDLSAQFPNHGFIQLETGEHDSININLVKRPPPEFYPAYEKFCSKFLPAAMLDLMEEASMIDGVSEVRVFMTKDSYTAACRCYMKTFLAMGLPRIGETYGVVISASDIDEFCVHPQPMLRARPVSLGEVGRAPGGVSFEDRLALAKSAKFVLVE
jgi:hypothetical protein